MRDSEALEMVIRAQRETFEDMKLRASLSLCSPVEVGAHNSAISSYDRALCSAFKVGEEAKAQSSVLRGIEKTYEQFLSESSGVSLLRADLPVPTPSAPLHRMFTVPKV